MRFRSEGRGFRYTSRGICATLLSVPGQNMISITMIGTRAKNLPTAVCRRADGREFYLHSRYDPAEEARFLIRDVPRRERTLYCVLGFGLGYHVKELLQRIPQSSHVAVLETGDACLSARLRAAEGTRSWAWMHNDRLHYLVHRDAQVAPLSLVDRLTRLRLLGLELVPHIPSMLTGEEFYRQAMAAIPEKFPVSLQNHMGAIDKMLEHPLRNFWANLSHCWRGIPIQNLRGIWNGRKLVIVSSGPSLTPALPALRASRGDALVLATASAVRILVANGIRPDLIASMDPYDANLAHFQGWDTTGIPLACPPRLHRDILASYLGPKLRFTLQEDPPVPLVPAPHRSDFWQGGSVAFTALQLAHYLGANPIIFVGQDFAFEGGHTHAEGSVVDGIYDPAALPKDFLLVPGVSGRPVVTNRLYHSYLLYMQDHLAKSAGEMPHVRHINTSATGARIQGMESMTLEQALALNATAGASPAEELAAALVPGEGIPRAAQQEAVAGWMAEIEGLLAGTAQEENFDRVFAKFRTTSAFRQASGCYEDVYYLYETRSGSRKEESNQTFLSRFREHLRNILADMGKFREAD